MSGRSERYPPGEPAPPYSPAELARQYSPSSLVPETGELVAEWTELSAQARRELDVVEDVAYGPDPAQRLDIFPATPGAPLVVFVHGGYWQELSRRESAFPALDLVPDGISFAALGYGLAPDHPLPAITCMVTDGVRWLGENLAGLPGSPGSVVLAGHSAGAHLVLEALLATRAAVLGAALIGGVYDLEPLSRTYVNDALGLDAATARACSPIHRLHRDLPPLLVIRGDNETDEFARQQELLLESVSRPGTAEVTGWVAPGRNHFDLPMDLGRSGTVLGDWVRRCAGSRPR